MHISQNFKHGAAAGVCTQLLFLAAVLSAVQGSPTCYLTNTTISAEKDGCPYCVTTVATICSGSCLTKDKVFKSVLSPMNQRICTYQEIRYESIRLPSCPPDVDPFYTYPVAVSCECSMCKTEYTDCSFRSLGPDFCSTKTLFR
uniref:Lutropin subunit beta-like n=1 Tax=Geotrypetes seraphini TaxID=260995 RepID=A0A6P8P0R3_GEOSA|nr:lutropin subunit beta-like [Geotrypetes seraphini]